MTEELRMRLFSCGGGGEGGFSAHSSGVSVEVSLPRFQVRKVKEIEDE